MKKILALLFLFLSSFCLTSCVDSVEKILQFGYDFVTLPTEVTENFTLISRYNVDSYDIWFSYISHNTDIIKIEKNQKPIFISDIGYSHETTCISRSEHDVDVLIECIITAFYPDEIKIKTFTVTVVGLEND